jgi:hypothetical protein
LLNKFFNFHETISVHIFLNFIDLVNPKENLSKDFVKSADERGMKLLHILLAILCVTISGCGSDGATGPAGPAGAQGPQGERGYTGLTGPSGDSGITIWL